MVGRESKQGNFRLLIKRHIRMAHVASELTLKLRYEEPSGHEKRGAAPLYCPPNSHLTTMPHLLESTSLFELADDDVPNLNAASTYSLQEQLRFSDIVVNHLVRLNGVVSVPEPAYGRIIMAMATYGDDAKAYDLTRACQGKIPRTSPTQFACDHPIVSGILPCASRVRQRDARYPLVFARYWWL